MDVSSGIDQRARLLVASAALALLLTSLLVTFAWIAFAPPTGDLDRPSILLPSLQPNPSFPLLSRERERFFLLLVSAALACSLGLTVTFHSVLRHLDTTRLAVVSYAAQTVLGIVALGALADTPPFFGLDVLGWGLPRVLAGAAVVTGAAVGLVLTSPSQRRRLRRPFVTVGCAGLVGVSGVIFAVSMLETPGSVRDVGNTAWVVNELLAPANGLHPLANYAATYSNVLGEVLVPFIRLGVDPQRAAIALIMVGAASVLLALLAVFRSTGMRWPVAAAGVVVCAAAGSFSRLFIELRPSGPSLRLPLVAFSYHQMMPVRMVLPLLLGLAVVRAVRTMDRTRLVAVGMLAALTAVNNIDIGGGAAAASVLAIGALGAATVRAGVSRWRAMVKTLLPVALGGLFLITVVAVFTQIVAGQLPSISSATFYFRLFAGGLIGLPLERAWGLQLLVIGTFAVSVVSALLLAMSGTLQRSGPTEADDRSLAAALAYFGLLGFVLVVYYLNRPVAPTLIGGCFVPWAINLVVLARAGVRVPRYARIASIPALVVLAVVCSTVFLQSLMPPDLGKELRRIREGSEQGRPALIAGRPEPAASDVVDFLRTSAGSPVVLLTPWPNSLALAAGGRSLTPLSAYPLSTYPEWDLLEAVLNDGHPDVILDKGFPYPEVQAMLRVLGYRTVEQDENLIRFRWEDSIPPSRPR